MITAIVKLHLPFDDVSFPPHHLIYVFIRIQTKINSPRGKFMPTSDLQSFNTHPHALDPRSIHTMAVATRDRGSLAVETAGLSSDCLLILFNSPAPKFC